MKKRNRSAIIGIGLLLFVSHIFLSWHYGRTLPWGGDEWFSYRDFTISGLPFSAQVLALKNLLPSLSAQNYWLYRFSNLIWTALLFLLIYQVYQQKPEQRPLVVFLVIILSISPFVLSMEQFFRYYNLYLLSAFTWFFGILLYDSQFPKYRFLFYIAALISIFIHFLLFWSIGFYLFFRELSLLKRRYQYIATGITLSLLIGFVAFGSPLLKTIFELAGSGNYQLPDSSLTRGWSLALFIKPFFAVFTFLFGEQTLPLESWLVNGLFVVSLLGLLIGLIQLYTNRVQFRAMLFAGLFPFVALYLLLEPFTLPGMTQFEPKHGLFFYPWLLLLWFQNRQHKYTCFFTVFPVLAGLTGLYYSFQSPQINWKAAVDTIEKYKAIILHDPSAESDLRFYGQQEIDTSQLISFSDTLQAQQLLDTIEKVTVATLDWKSYQYLRLDQMWNSASDSEGRLARIKAVYNKLQDAGFQAVDTYISYPLIVICLKKTNGKTDANTISPIPYFFPIAYRDLEMPVELENEKYLGWYPLAIGEKLAIQKKSFTYFISTTQPDLTAPAISVTYINGQQEDLFLAPEKDTYRTYHCRALQNSDLTYSWRKRPLVSSNKAYPGSIWPSNGYIFTWNADQTIQTIEILDPSIQLNYVL